MIEIHAHRRETAPTIETGLAFQLIKKTSCLLLISCPLVFVSLNLIISSSKVSLPIILFTAILTIRVETITVFGK